MRTGLRDPADRFLFDRLLFDRPLFGEPMIRYGEMKTTHWFSELALELEIIKISPEFVASFLEFAEEKHFDRKVRERC
jgi:hypothetical protein